MEGGDMENIYPNNLEKALAKTESDVNATLKATASVVSSLKKFRIAIGTGNLRELNKIIESSEQAIAALKQQFINTKEGWNFDSENYISSRAFPEEILQTAREMNVKIFEQDERLYCYPFLISILPNEMSVKIDKKKERRVRPSVLVSHLKSLQNKPVKFKSEVFIEGLFSAYEALKALIRGRGQDHAGEGIVIPLLEIYKLLTIMPGLSKEYSQQEFARDLYLLDKNGITKKGFVISLPASTGTKSIKSTIKVITQEGSEKKYYGISFSRV
jgi:hypothetical protein